MNCPECGASSKVIESRTVDGTMRRRRRCGNDHRFSTDEVLVVVKRDAIKKNRAAIAADTRNPMVVALEYGVSLSAVYSMRRAAREAGHG